VTNAIKAIPVQLALLKATIAMACTQETNKPLQPSEEMLMAIVSELLNTKFIE